MNPCWLVAIGVAWADPYFVETSPVADRAAAEAVEMLVDQAGLDARVVRRFQLGVGWGFAVLVEGLTDEGVAREAAAKVRALGGADPSIYLLEARERVSVPASAPTAAEPPARTAAWWIDAADRALGGASGGAAGLARAGAVRFEFERTFEQGGKTVTVVHRYWREAGSRRLEVDTDGFGQDSVAVVTPSGGWIQAGGAVKARDIGVLIGTVDGFAPEAVLTVALEGHHILASPEVRSFQLLDGAERGIRLGSTAEEGEPGLAWVELDPSTARPLRLRYVTQGGPLEWELSDWREVAPGVVAPHAVRLERPDGKTERFRVRGLRLQDAAPPGTFEPPAQ